MLYTVSDVLAERVFANSNEHVEDVEDGEKPGSTEADAGKKCRKLEEQRKRELRAFQACSQPTATSLRLVTGDH